MTQSNDPRGTELFEGVDDQSPVSRIIALGWYDGPTEGILQIGATGANYRFQMIDEDGRGAAGLDPRVFRLYALPPDAFDSIIAAIDSPQEPRWPVWAPIWKFPTEEVRIAAERKIDEIMALAGPLAWLLVGDLVRGPVRVVSLALARAS